MEYCLFTGLFVIYLMQFSVTCYVTAWLQTIEFNLRLHYSLCISYQSSVILLSDKHNSLSLSLYIYIYIYIYVCVCVCVCARARFLTVLLHVSAVQISHHQVGHWYTKRVKWESFVRRSLFLFTLFVTHCPT